MENNAQESKIDVFCELGEESVKVGSIYSHWRRNTESMTFIYDESYLSRPDSYALEPGLPLHSGAHQTPTGKKIFGAFSDSSPDRWGRRIIERRESERARNAREAPRAMSEATLMLAIRDDLRQGALRFSQEPGVFLANESDGIPAKIALPHLIELARKIDTEESNYSEMQELFLAGGSLGGARPKAHISYGDGSLAIAKFSRPDADEWDVIAWEKTVLDLAKNAKIKVPESQLVQAGAEKVLLLKRFDRIGEKRLGYLSAMTMLEKNEMEQGSYLDIAEKIETVSLNAAEELQELWRRMVFTVLITNKDDHLKNHGFLKSRGEAWELSPAFDLNPNPKPGRILATAIDEKNHEASLDLCFSVLQYFRLGRIEALGILDQVAASTSKWKEVALTHGISATEAKAMTSAFAHSESRRAEALLG